MSAKVLAPVLPGLNASEENSALMSALVCLHRKGLSEYMNLTAVTQGHEKQRRLELNGSICLGILWEGTSPKGCRVNPALKSLGEDWRDKDAETAAFPSPLALFKSNVCVHKDGVGSFHINFGTLRSLQLPCDEPQRQMKITGDSPQLRKANAAPTFKKGQIDNLRKHSLVSLTFLLGKIME
ncbi:hypothetical protein QYF61_023062 [Mycteria americana]|uniref:Uncharacterized protein n=1 Tax=Mycteria americana TaxID=33587 RepID=A0AAN7NBT7_MYCAM|nr:hypothetical protein QYF61_023062 [Mycteria americana]